MIENSSGPCFTEPIKKVLLAATHDSVVRHLNGFFEPVINILHWSDINNIVSNFRFTPPRIRLVEKGRNVPLDDYVSVRHERSGRQYRALDVGRIEGQLSAGATLVIDSVDELTPDIRGLATQMEILFKRAIQINAYIALGSTHGFPIHADPHDVFVFQAKGRKHWRVYEHCAVSDPTRDHPSKGYVAFDGILNEGDVLYIPKGWEHEAFPLGEATIHLSAGVDRVGMKEYVIWLSEQMEKSKLFQAIYPIEGVVAECPHNDELLATVKNGIDRFPINMFLSDYEAKSAYRRGQMELPVS